MLRIYYLITQLLVLSFGVQGQADSVQTNPTGYDLIGTWKNALYAFERIKIGSQKSATIYDSRIDISNSNAQSDPPGKYFTIMADGRFFDVRYYDAKWQLLGDRLIISSPVGQPVHAKVMKADSTNVYSIVLNGVVYLKTNLKNFGVIRH